MNKALKVFLHEIRQNARRKAYWVTTIGVPLVGLLIVVGVIVYGNIQEARESEDPEAAPTEETTDEENETRIGYVDLSGEFPDLVVKGEEIPVYDSEEAASNALKSGDINAYYVIAADYAETGTVIRNAPQIDIMNLATEGFDIAMRQVLISRHIEDETQRKAVAMRLSDPANFRQEVVKPAGDAPPEETESEEVDDQAGFEADFPVVYLFAMTMIMSIFLTSNYLMRSVIEEKETRIVEIILTSVKPLELMIGKITALGTLGLLQMLTWLLGGYLIVRIGASQVPFLSNIDIPLNGIGIMIPYFILSYLMFAAFYASVGAISKSMKEGPQIATLITLPAMAPFYMSALITEDPNGTISTILSIFPLTAPFGMSQRIAITPVPLIEIVIGLVLLALTDIFLIWIAGRLFRVNTLLSGQRFSLKETIALIVRG